MSGPEGATDLAAGYLVLTIGTGLQLAVGRHHGGGEKVLASHLTLGLGQPP